MKKKCFLLLSLFLLSNCMQSTAMLGPAVTVATSGNIYQAGLSYGLNETLEKTTGKSTMENTKILLEKAKKYQNKVEEYKQDTKKKIESIKINSDEFFASVKSNIEKTRGNLLD